MGFRRGELDALQFSSFPAENRAALAVLAGWPVALPTAVVGTTVALPAVAKTLAVEARIAITNVTRSLEKRALSRRVDRLANNIKPEDAKAIRSYQNQIDRHIAKMNDFMRNPTVRPGMKGLPKETIAAQQAARVAHLEKEIATFRSNIGEILGKY